MPSITNGSTTYNLITLDGEAQPLGLMLEDVTRPGVNGHGFRELARHADPFAMVGWLDVNNNAACKTTFDAMVAAYAGKIVTVVDDQAASHTNLVCLKVERVDSYRLITAVGGVSVSKGAMLAVRFTLQSTA